jgi:hypothetical protein
MFTKKNYLIGELSRLIRGIIGIILIAYALSRFFEYDFGFWPFFTLIMGMWLFPKLHPRTYYEFDKKYYDLPD